MDPTLIGKKVKATYPTGVAKDGRAYANIPDAEIGSMFYLKNGDQGAKSLGINVDQMASDSKIKQQKDAAKPVIQGLVTSLDDLKGKAADVNVGDVMLNKLTGGNLGTKAANYETSQKLIGQYLAKLVEKNRLSDADRQFYQKEIMNVGAVGYQPAIESKLDNLKNEMIRLSGYAPEDFKSGSAQKKNEGAGVASRLIKGAAKNIVDTTTGTGQLVGNAVESGKNIVKDVRDTGGKNIQWQNALPALGQAGGAVLNNLNETVGKPLEGGDVVGRAVTHAIDNPVDTATWLLPPTKLAKEAGVAGKLGNATKVVTGGVAARGENMLPSIGNNLVKNSEKASSVITGGGTKDLIARNVNLDDAVDMDKTLLSNGINGKLTMKGKIEKTQKGLVDEGLKIDKTLRNSPVRWNTKDFADAAGAYLTDRYGEAQAPVIQEVVNQMSKAGDFNMEAGNQTLSPLVLNQAKTGLYDYGLRQLGIGEGGKIYNQMARDLASYIRQNLAAKVPEATPHLRAWGNLRTYQDDILKNPTGMQLRNGIISNITGGLQDAAGAVNQGVYNAGKAMGGKSELPPIRKVTPETPPDVAPPVADTLPSIRPSAKPVEQAVMDTVYKGKGEPQVTRLKRDMRSGDFKLRPSDERKYRERVLEASKKKRYK